MVSAQVISQVLIRRAAGSLDTRLPGCLHLQGWEGGEHHFKLDYIGVLWQVVLELLDYSLISTIELDCSLSVKPPFALMAVFYTHASNQMSVSVYTQTQSSMVGGQVPEMHWWLMITRASSLQGWLKLLFFFSLYWFYLQTSYIYFSKTDQFLFIYLNNLSNKRRSNENFVKLHVTQHHKAVLFIYQ